MQERGEDKDQKTKQTECTVYFFVFGTPRGVAPPTLEIAFDFLAVRFRLLRRGD